MTIRDVRPNPSTKSLPVLIVDDDKTTTAALAKLMDQAGYSTVICNGGTDALRTVADTRFAAAVIDVHLQDMNGLVLARALRDRLGPESAIIILSGDTSMETIKSLPHAGATFFFSKPVHGAELIERLKQWLA